MRITDIEIKNFRAFRGTYQINLSKSGKNLLVYGENGSGKSSLYLALKLFLESSVDEDSENIEFGVYQNIFTEDPAYIKLSLRPDRESIPDVYEWSQGVKGETSAELIIDVSKTKGFFDYKSLLETHYVHRENDTVNLFNLLVKVLLANTFNPVRERSLTEDWDDIQPNFRAKMRKSKSQPLKVG